LLLKDHFNIQGPIGTHSCLVYEAMGPSVITMSMDLVSGEAIMDGQNKRFTLSTARRILHQVLLGLDFIHSKGLVHGDFHSGNWLFSLREMSNLSIEDVRQSENRVSAPVRRLDGSSDSSAPPFITLDQPLREWIATGNDLQIKISDLGSGK
jgi:serine/threonine-protein kinase SRPK3